MHSFILKRHAGEWVFPAFPRDYFLSVLVIYSLLGQFTLADIACGVADSLPQICLKYSLPGSCLDHHFSYDISASSFC